MTNFANLFSTYTVLVTIPCLAIISIFFCIKQRTKDSMVFALGIVLMAVGALIQFFSPFGTATIDEAGKVLSSSGPPLSWYAGSIVTSFGLIITVVGFALVTWRNKLSACTSV